MEQDGIVFIDEIDKIVVNSELRYGMLSSFSPCMHPACSLQAASNSPTLYRVAGAAAATGADASSEGVQRDLLPIIEGSQVRAHSLMCATATCMAAWRPC